MFFVFDFPPKIIKNFQNLWIYAFQTEICLHAVRKPPAQNLPAVQINYGCKIHHAPRSLDVSDVGCHNLIWERDKLVPQKIRESLSVAFSKYNVFPEYMTKWMYVGER